MKDEAQDQRSGGRGRPPKPLIEKKIHRVQVAMSDQQKADASALAEIHGVKLSTAVADAVTVALNVARFDKLVDNIVERLTSAAEQTRRELDDGGLTRYAGAQEPENYRNRVLTVGDVDASWTGLPALQKYLDTARRFPLYIDFAGSAKAYRELVMPLREIYDVSIRKYAVRYAENIRDTVGLEPSANVLPSSPAVLFGFNLTTTGLVKDSAGRHDKLFAYLQPLDGEGIDPF
jgi:hypothetical protein